MRKIGSTVFSQKGNYRILMWFRPIIDGLPSRRLKALNIRHYEILKDLSLIDAKRMEDKKNYSWRKYVKTINCVEYGVFWIFNKLKI